MSLFVCDQCHGIDNTACGGNYWDRLIKDGKKKNSGMVLCAECYTGTWHGRFEKRIFNPATDKVSDFCYIPQKLRNKRPQVVNTRTLILPNGAPLKCQPTGRTLLVKDIPDGKLFEFEGDIWEKLPGSCGNISNFNDEGEVIGFVRVNEWEEIK